MLKGIIDENSLTGSESGARASNCFDCGSHERADVDDSQNTVYRFPAEFPRPELSLLHSEEEETSCCENTSHRFQLNRALRLSLSISLLCA